MTPRGNPCNKLVKDIINAQDKVTVLESKLREAQTYADVIIGRRADEITQIMPGTDVPTLVDEYRARQAARPARANRKPAPAPEPLPTPETESEDAAVLASDPFNPDSYTAA